MTLLAFRPFIDPIPLVSWQKLAMLLPLCLAIATVYKTTKCRDLRDVPIASLVLWVTIIIGMFAVGIGLFVAYNLFA